MEEVKDIKDLSTNEIRKKIVIGRLEIAIFGNSTPSYDKSELINEYCKRTISSNMWYLIYSGKIDLNENTNNYENIKNSIIEILEVSRIIEVEERFQEIINNKELFMAIINQVIVKYNQMMEMKNVISNSKCREVVKEEAKKLLNKEIDYNEFSNNTLKKFEEYNELQLNTENSKKM